jgi:predicted phosphodiesterase
MQLLSNNNVHILSETNSNLSLEKIDLSSDLHIDQWDKTLEVKNPCGKVKHFPYSFKETTNKILVIAGDISDNIDLSIKYLNEQSDKYERILFVDGNHEHASSFPNLLDINTINEKIQKLNNEKIVYLPKTHYKLGKTIFIGYCGWWDYDNNKQESIESALSYFESWIKEIAESTGASLSFINNVMKNSYNQHELLKKHLDYYQNDETIEEIVIVTHTVPLKQLALDENGNIETSCQLQSSAESLLEKYSKLKKWIFGHTHNQMSLVKDGVHFVSNPRGRPEDFDREEYILKDYNNKN